MLCEGGRGDFLHFCRYVNQLVAEGAAAVYCQPPPEMVDLIRDSLIPVQIVRLTLDNIAECDYWTYPFDLFLRYQTGFEDPPQPIGYLNPVRGPVPGIALAADYAQDKSRVRKKVGIVWRSDNHACRHEPFRSATLEAFKPLFEDTTIKFHSLQFGVLTEGEAAILNRHGVIDLSPQIATLAHTSAILAQLDLLISIDSVPVHLAGGCNRPVWTLLSHAADGRWGHRSR
jgi:hypothetical protein